MEYNSTPDSWDQAEDSSMGDQTDTSQVRKAFTNLNVDAAEFVPGQNPFAQEFVPFSNPNDNCTKGRKSQIFFDKIYLSSCLTTFLQKELINLSAVCF